MTAAKLRASRNSRVVRAMRQEWREARAHADRNFLAAARWDRVYLRALADAGKAAAA